MKKPKREVRREMWVVERASDGLPLHASYEEATARFFCKPGIERLTRYVPAKGFTRARTGHIPPAPTTKRRRKR